MVSDAGLFSPNQGNLLRAPHDNLQPHVTAKEAAAAKGPQPLPAVTGEAVTAVTRAVAPATKAVAEGPRPPLAVTRAAVAAVTKAVSAKAVAGTFIIH